MTRQADDVIGDFDYIIVGAGSAGCVLANRLSTDPTINVLLLEAGGNDDRFWVRMPLGLHKVIGNPEFDWRFSAVPDPALANRALVVPRGKSLGGSSTINGMVYVRGQRQDYDTWRQLGNRGWSWDDVLPYFRKSEDFAGGASEQRGAGGELRVEHVGLRWEIIDAVRDACAQIGIPKVDDYVSNPGEGSSYYQLTRRRGQRFSSATAFLRPAMSRRNLTVLTHAATRRIVVEDGRAVAVEFTRDGSVLRAACREEVILSAGSIGSPQLLELSGIGSAERLSHLGIAVVADRPGVGENLQDHATTRHQFRVHGVKTLNGLAHSKLGQVGAGLRYFLFRRGALTSGGPTAMVMARSSPNYETPNIQVNLMPLIYGADMIPPKFPGVSAGVNNLRPSSRGSVHISAPDPTTPPEIRFNFLSTYEDRKVAIDSIRLVRRIFAQPALQRYAPEETVPGEQASSEDELLAVLRETLSTVFHPSGTCKMGGDAMAVVDERLRVTGVQGIRVADASIMPTVVSGNTNATAIMIGEKAADMIFADRRSEQSRHQPPSSAK